MSFMSLDRFKANFNDGVRNNRFQVMFPDPLTENIDDAKRLSYFVKTATTPNRGVNIVEVDWQGLKMKIAGDPLPTEPITITFHGDYDNIAHGVLTTWLRKIAEPLTNDRATPGAYKREMMILQYGRGESEELKRYTLRGAFPTNISQVDLQQAEGEIVEFTCEFAYDDFLEEWRDAQGNWIGKDPQDVSIV